MAVAALAVLSVAGAAIAAAIHSTSGLSYEADAVVVIASDPPNQRGSFRRARWQLLAASLRQPAVAAAAQRRGLAGSPRSLAAKIRLSGDPVSGLLVVRARDQTPARAIAVANAFAQAGAQFVEDAYTSTAGVIAAADFESGLRAWDNSQAAFALQPGQLSLTTGLARFNEHALRVACPGSENCGTWTTLDYPFRRGERYTATAWVRSTRADARLRLLFGTNTDLAMDSERQPGSRWRRMTVSWRPRAATSAAHLAVATSGGPPGMFDLDGMAIWENAVLERPEQTQIATREREERLFDEVPALTTFPARSIGTVGPSGPVFWALAGAAAGLLAGLAGIGAGSAAGRRRDRPS
jgi:hypothetical protein